MGYAFNYLRADREEKRIGLSKTKEEAEIKRSRFASFGAICSEVFPTEDEPPTKKENYAEQRLDEFKEFFKKEMALLKAPGMTYYIVYQFLLTFLYRVKLYVAENDWSKSPSIDNFVEITGYPPNFYLEEVAKIISDEADYYSPVDGSVSESKGKELKKLASQVKSGQVLDKEKAQKDLISGFKNYSL